MAELHDVAVRQIKNEPKCKICKSPHRDEIDGLLLERSFRVTRDDGTVVNGDFVRRRLVELGVQNPTHENLTSHWKNHCQVVSKDSEEEIADLVEGVLASVSIEELQEMTTSERLDLLELQGYAELQARIKTTGKSGLSTDQLLRIAEIKQRQKQNEDQRKFFTALGAGVAAALGRGAEQRALPVPDGEVIDAAETDVVEVPA